jgi:predicted ATPase
MLIRLYANNFRCFENFEFKTNELTSLLVIGENGSGKTTATDVLEIFQKIGRGVSRLREVVSPRDFSYGKTTLPMSLELTARIDGHLYKYQLILELPPDFREIRIQEENLQHQGETLFSRKLAQVNLARTNNEASFSVDWHLVALPIIQVNSDGDPLRRFRDWLARMIILAPCPYEMTGESDGETLEPEKRGSNFANWFTGLLARYPAAYREIDEQLRSIMPDISDIYNEPTGENSKNINARFLANECYFSTSFHRLSDGEKCFFLLATTLAASKYCGPLLCLWDEPDNYLSLAEVGHVIVSLRRQFGKDGQFIATSHNEETIRKFSNENTIIFSRSSHLEPTRVQWASELSIHGSLVENIKLGGLAQ